MISIIQLKKGFVINGKRVSILDIPRWDISEGEKIAIIGPSGSGKSTLLHLIGGITKVDQGQITVNSNPLHLMSEADRDRFRAAHVGFILQDFHLIPSLTAKQNIELVMTTTGSAKERKTLLEDWFDRVGLSDRTHHLPSQLSRGQQQRVAIVRALINNPPLILADEPTGSLDWETAGEITDLLLKTCLSDGTMLITVTHDLNMAQKFNKSIHIGEINKAHDQKRDLIGALPEEAAV